MLQLDFPTYSFRFKNSENKTYVFDVIRKKFVVLKAEEWVRQHVIHFLIKEKKYPVSLIQVEKQLIVNSLKKRYDVIVFSPNGAVVLAVECKAPSVAITQKTFDQVARYNLSLNAKYIMVTNGLKHFYCTLNPSQKGYLFLSELPDYA